VKSWTLTVTSPEEMEALGFLFGEQVNTPCVLWLSGDLGAGKTCFTRGFARGFGVPADEPVTSPSYTLMNHYRGRLDLFHFDLYRLEGFGDAEDIGFEECLYGDGVTIVEWADRFPFMETEGARLDFAYIDETVRTVSIEPCGAQWEEPLNQFISLWADRRNE